MFENIVPHTHDTLDLLLEYIIIHNYTHSLFFFKVHNQTANHLISTPENK